MTTSDRPPLSVIVATKDRAEELARCLDRLLAVVATADEVLVVDSGSGDDGVRRVTAPRNVRCIRLDKPGASLARNTGWRAAEHDLVAFIDDDVLVHEGWADAMATTLGGTEFVTGWIGVPPGQEHLPGPLPLMVEPTSRELTASSRGAFGAGANWGAQRHALEAVGGFDEQLGPGTWLAAAEDQELFDRLVLAGFTGRYDPDVKVDHDQWRSRWQRVVLHWRYGKGMGARLAKLARTDTQRFRAETADALWHYGVVSLVREARDRWLGGVACSVARLTGTLVGFSVQLTRARISGSAGNAVRR